MIVWRVIPGHRVTTTLNGEGARLFGGRWNPKGIPIVYTSSSLSLAILEILVNTGPELLPPSLYKVKIYVPEDVELEEVNNDMLPNNWNTYPAPFQLALIGKDWITEGRTAILSVPSAIVLEESNFLLNPQHEEFPRITVVDKSELQLDKRLIVAPSVPDDSK